jgi:hypothetical protein
MEYSGQQRCFLIDLNSLYQILWCDVRNKKKARELSHGPLMLKIAVAPLLRFLFEPQTESSGKGVESKKSLR